MQFGVVAGAVRRTRRVAAPSANSAFSSGTQMSRRAAPDRVRVGVEVSAGAQRARRRRRPSGGRTPASRRGSRAGRGGSGRVGPRADLEQRSAARPGGWRRRTSAGTREIAPRVDLGALDRAHRARHLDPDAAETPLEARAEEATQSAETQFCARCGVPPLKPSVSACWLTLASVAIVVAAAIDGLQHGDVLVIDERVRGPALAQVRRLEHLGVADRGRPPRPVGPLDRARGCGRP